MRPRVAFLLPTLWDRRQLEACRAGWQGVVEPVLFGPEDHEVGDEFDVLAFAHDVAARLPDLAGVTSSSDYPGAAAAALVAERLGLPGTAARDVLRAGHKGEARARQAEALPDATPRFRVLEVDGPAAQLDGLAFPCFVKPVRGSFSVLAREVADRRDLEAFLAHPDVRTHRDQYAEPHRRLMRALGETGSDPGTFLAEGLLHGRQATVEGWSFDGDVHVLGVVDSFMVPGTRAFSAFETPSRLPADVQRRMVEQSRVAVRALDLVHGCWNAEWTWDEATDRIGLLEVNPRLAGQFGDLWQNVRGISGFEIAMSVARGLAPSVPERGAFARAASVPLRTFAPVRVAHAPDADAIEAAEQRRPGTHVFWDCKTGDVLSGFDGAGEGQGWRYAVINLGGGPDEDLVARAHGLAHDLGSRLEPLAGAARG